MRYSKPELSGYKAIAVIQSGSTQKIGMVYEIGLTVKTIPAYEADE